MWNFICIRCMGKRQ